MNYSNTTTYKTVLYRLNEINSSFLDAGVSLWRSTNAINRITLQGGSGSSLQSGTMATLYGIASA